MKKRTDARKRNPKDHSHTLKTGTSFLTFLVLSPEQRKQPKPLDTRVLNVSSKTLFTKPGYTSMSHSKSRLKAHPRQLLLPHPQNPANTEKHTPRQNRIQDGKYKMQTRKTTPTTWPTIEIDLFRQIQQSRCIVKRGTNTSSRADTRGRPWHLCTP